MGQLTIRTWGVGMLVEVSSSLYDGTDRSERWSSTWSARECSDCHGYRDLLSSCRSAHTYISRLLTLSLFSSLHSPRTRFQRIKCPHTKHANYPTIHRRSILVNPTTVPSLSTTLTRLLSPMTATHPSVKDTEGREPRFVTPVLLATGPTPAPHAALPHSKNAMSPDHQKRARSR